MLMSIHISNLAKGIFNVGSLYGVGWAQNAKNYYEARYRELAF